MLSPRRRLQLLLCVFATGLGLAACEESDPENDCRAIDDGEFAGREGFIHKCDEGPLPADFGGVRSDASVEISCNDDADCDRLRHAYPCVQCADGSNACPEPACNDGVCEVALERLCPELEAAFACETDADCERCKFRCEDGRDACAGNRCENGTCKTTFGVCETPITPCPEFTSPLAICVACAPAGECSALRPYCAHVCDGDDDCRYAGQACFSPDGGGLCLPETAFGCANDGLHECEVDADCEGVAAGALSCVPCEDGSEMCPEPDCFGGACLLTVEHYCPELESVFACETAADCEPCFHQCPNGSTACLPASCENGLCRLAFLTCGQAEKPCPPATRPFFECVSCGLSGGCAIQRLTCAGVCESDADCKLDGEICYEPEGVCVGPFAFSCV